MDLTTFDYIKSIPEVIDNAVWYELAVRSYNLGLTAMWFLILWFALDFISTSLFKLYKRGHD